MWSWRHISLPQSPRLRTRSFLFRSLLMRFLIPMTSSPRLKVTSPMPILRWKLRVGSTPLRLKLLKKNYLLFKRTWFKKIVASSHSKKKSRIQWIFANKDNNKLTILDNQWKWQRIYASKRILILKLFISRYPKLKKCAKRKMRIYKLLKARNKPNLPVLRN